MGQLAAVVSAIWFYGCFVDLEIQYAPDDDGYQLPLLEAQTTGDSVSDGCTPVTLAAVVPQTLGSLGQRPSGCGLSGIRAVQIVVPDLEAALAIYRDQFGLPAEVRPPNAEGQLAVCTPPSGSRLELLTPSDPHSKTGRFLQEQGSGLFAIVHESEDAEASARSIQAAGIDVEQAAEDLWDIDPSTTFGARLRIRSASSS